MQKIDLYHFILTIFMTVGILPLSTIPDCQRYGINYLTNNADFHFKLSARWKANYNDRLTDQPTKTKKPSTHKKKISVNSYSLITDYNNKFHFIYTKNLLHLCHPFWKLKLSFFFKSYFNQITWSQYENAHFNFPT